MFWWRWQFLTRPLSSSIICLIEDFMSNKSVMSKMYKGFSVMLCSSFVDPPISCGFVFQMFLLLKEMK